LWNQLLHRHLSLPPDAVLVDAAIIDVVLAVVNLDTAIDGVIAVITSANTSESSIQRSVAVQFRR
jgi:hypothetical protein